MNRNQKDNSVLPRRIVGMQLIKANEQHLTMLLV